MFMARMGKVTETSLDNEEKVYCEFKGGIKEYERL